MAETSIEWTRGDDGTPGVTWNCVTGCDQVSPGCDRCYAKTLAARLKAMGQAKYQNDGDPRTSGPGFGLTIHPDTLDLPFKWKKPRRVFVNSMSDLFHEDVPDEFILRVFEVMRKVDRHSFQVLTKRSRRLASFTRRLAWRTPTIEERNQGLFGGQPYLWDDGDANQDHHSGPAPLKNLQLGVSIETDRYTFRADHLRTVPAAVRFLSLEPLLGPLPSLDLTGIGWVIVGAESGRGARPMNLDWVRDIRDRCVVDGVPFFFKQDALKGKKVPTPELDGRTWTEFPVA